MISSIEAKPKSQLLNTEYDRTEQQFIQLLETEDLDNKLAAKLVSASEFEKVLHKAIEIA